MIFSLHLTRRFANIAHAWLHDDDTWIAGTLSENSNGTSVTTNGFQFHGVWTAELIVFHDKQTISPLENRMQKPP